MSTGSLQPLSEHKVRQQHSLSCLEEDRVNIFIVLTWLEAITRRYMSNSKIGQMRTTGTGGLKDKYQFVGAWVGPSKSVYSLANAVKHQG